MNRDPDGLPPVRSGTISAVNRPISARLGATGRMRLVGSPFTILCITNVGMQGERRMPVSVALEAAAPLSVDQFRTKKRMQSVFARGECLHSIIGRYFC